MTATPLADAELTRRVDEVYRDLLGALRDLQQARWTQAGPAERLDERIHGLASASAFLDRAAASGPDLPDRAYGAGTERRAYYATGAYIVALVAALLVTGRGLAGLVIASAVAMLAMVAASRAYLARFMRRDLERVAHSPDAAGVLADLDRLIEVADPDQRPEVLENLRHARRWLEDYTE
ncbi:MAG TPA: hypothetical protein VL738_16880 [Dactylosporangium sp.]|jgi:hypothetical protein|nr:hypothetical protein [Dactylosporangium sp.]